MANEEQLSILKQGITAWNEWREKNEDVHIDLSEGDLRGMFSAYNPSIDILAALTDDVHPVGVDITDLIEDAVRDNDLLGRAFNTRLYFKGVNLSWSNLSGANLKGAWLYFADFSNALLLNTDFSDAILNSANFYGAHLNRSNFTRARIGSTIFGHCNLNDAIGLDSVSHDGPSDIMIHTFTHSKGSISDAFLRGCGLSDWEIESVKLYSPDLTNEERNRVLYKIYDLQASQAIQVSPLFISYSHTDSKFVDKLGKCLQDKGIRYWRDIHDMKSGRLEKQIDRAIQQNPIVLLVLSELSLSSDWVEHEVRTGRELEKETGRDVLCPVALDDSWKSSRWPKRIVEQIMEYNILDFSDWKDDVKFGSMFRKLIDGLELFYKG